MELRVLVVDDSVLFRHVISEILSGMDHVRVIGTAANGSIGLKKAEQLKPDIVTLDIEMPKIDGLTVLPKILEVSPNSKVIMLSSLTKKGADITIQALAQGAFDFIEKPEHDNPNESERDLKWQLKKILNVIVTRTILESDGKIKVPKKLRSPPKSDTGPTEEILTRIQAQKVKVAVVVIGISTGGPGALPILLQNLPENLNVPILIVQHMPPLFVSALVESLEKPSVLPVVEAKPNESILPNKVYIAPGDKQMKVFKRAGQTNVLIQLTDDPEENFCKPSVDYLFRSIAQNYGASALGVIMTGMGKDGTEGLRMMKNEGSTIYGQDQESSVVYGMAQEAGKAGVVDQFYSLKVMGAAIAKRVKIIF